MELVTVKIFNTEIEAELIKIYLDSKDVKAFVFGNILANTYNLFNMTSGGVHLKVNEEDYEKTVNLLNEYYYGSSNKEMSDGVDN